MMCEVCRAKMHPYPMFDLRGKTPGWTCPVCNHRQYPVVGRRRARSPSARQARQTKYAMDFVAMELARRYPISPFQELAADILGSRTGRLMTFTAKFQRRLVPRPLAYYMEAAYLGGPVERARLLRLIMRLHELEGYLARMAAGNPALPVVPIDFRRHAERAAQRSIRQARYVLRWMKIPKVRRVIWRAQWLMALALYREEDGDIMAYLRDFLEHAPHPEAEQCPLDERPDLWERILGISLR